jgi:hypothetical protein
MTHLREGLGSAGWAVGDRAIDDRDDGRPSRDLRWELTVFISYILYIESPTMAKVQWPLVAVVVCCIALVDSFSLQRITATSKNDGPERLGPKEKLRWITCSSTNELSSAVSRFVRPGDAVAELGSQLRDVSTTICESLEGTGSAVLVDVARKFPKNIKVEEDQRTRAMRRPGDEVYFYPGVASFVEIQELDRWRSAFSESETDSFDVFILDVNAIVGNDLEWTSLSIAREFSAIYASCRVVLVKSVTLNQWASKLVHGQRWVDNQGVNKGSRARHIIATVGVTDYRKTIPFTVQAGDSVLEVGCHLGTSTALLNQAAGQDQGDAGYCIGVDVGPKIIQGAKERHPGVYFSLGDAWKTAGLLRIQQDFNACHEQESKRLGFDVIYVDVGGLSGSDGLLEAISLLSSLENALEPQYIVIKSLCMRRLASTLVPYRRAR